METSLPAFALARGRILALRVTTIASLLAVLVSILAAGELGVILILWLLACALYTPALVVLSKNPPRLSGLLVPLSLGSLALGPWLIFGSIASSSNPFGPSLTDILPGWMLLVIALIIAPLFLSHLALVGITIKTIYDLKRKSDPNGRSSAVLVFSVLFFVACTTVSALLTSWLA